MKQKLFFFLMVSALFAGLPIHAHDFEVDGVYYGYDTNTRTAYVTYADNDKYSKKYSGDVVIPSTVTFNSKVLDVTSIEKYAFYNCNKVKSIIIEEGVSEIGERAFEGCTGISTIVVPNSVSS